MKTSKSLISLLIGATLVTMTWRACAGERAATQATFMVKDDLGEPVVGATVSMSTFGHWVPGQGFGKDVSETFTGLTDENGIVTITGRSLDGSFKYRPRGEDGYGVEGHYPTGVESLDFEEKKGGRWHPWNPQIEIIIKRIINPIPMFAKEVRLVLPASGEAVGFDLMVGEMVAPRGEGRVADLVFRATEEVPFVEALKPYKGQVSIELGGPPNGILEMIIPPNERNGFLLPREAPEEGYGRAYVRTCEVREGGANVEPLQREGHHFYLRIRGEVDGAGQLKSAHYARVIKDFRLSRVPDGYSLRFTYHLNPTPLDRNMEFDRKQNLFDAGR